MPRPMTITEKILAAHAGVEEVEPGQLINCRLDIVLANDVTAPIAIKEFVEIGVDKVWDPAKIALVPDHYTPNKDIKSAEQAKMMRDFAARAGHHALLRDRLHGRRARAAARAGRRGAGRRDHRRRLAHVHLRRARGVRHGRWIDRCRCGDGDRRGVVQGARVHQVRHRRRARAVGQRQGRHPAHHRHDRCRRSALPGDGVHRLDHRGRWTWTAA